MQIQGKAYRVSVYIGEDDHTQGKPLYMAILEYLKREGAAGATVVRGLAGFGAHSQIHTANIITLSADLPIKVEWVDVAERVERLLPQVRQMVNDGLITVDEVEVVQYAAGRWPDPLDQPVHNVMRNEVLTVGPDTPVDQVVTLLLHRGYRSLPVIDEERRLLGIITDGDLLRRANIYTRLTLQSALAPAQLQAELAELQSQAKRAADIMTKEVATVHAEEPVRRAVAEMVERNVKRLPVVDETGRLAGLISRVDVLRAVEYHADGGEITADRLPSGTTIADLMYRDVPTVGPQAQLEEIIRALETSRRRRAVVIDTDRHVLGIITDGDLIRRSRHAEHPNLQRRLRNLVTGYRDVGVALPDAGETAVNLMSAPVETVSEDTSLTEALRLMLARKIKRIPVVDANGQLIGLLGRASVLRGLLEHPDGKE